MDKTAELNRASHVLLDAEVKLSSVGIQIENLDRQIALLTSIEAHLEENINILRLKRVIVLVSEFKKAKEDLNTARTRRAFLRVDRENLLKMQTHYDMMYKKAKWDYERAYNLLYNPPNNVIQGNFGRKDG